MSSGPDVFLPQDGGAGGGAGGAGARAARELAPGDWDGRRLRRPLDRASVEARRLGSFRAAGSDGLKTSGTGTCTAGGGDGGGGGGDGGGGGNAPSPAAFGDIVHGTGESGGGALCSGACDGSSNGNTLGSARRLARQPLT